MGKFWKALALVCLALLLLSHSYLLQLHVDAANTSSALLDDKIFKVFGFALQFVLLSGTWDLLKIISRCSSEELKEVALPAVKAVVSVMFPALVAVVFPLPLWGIQLLSLVALLIYVACLYALLQSLADLIKLRQKAA